VFSPQFAFRDGLLAMCGNRMVGGSLEPALFGACGFENKVVTGAQVAAFEMGNKLPAANVPDGKFRMRRIRFRNENRS